MQQSVPVKVRRHMGQMGAATLRLRRFESAEEITDMIRHALADPERREALLDLLDKIGIMPRNP